MSECPVFYLDVVAGGIHAIIIAYCVKLFVR